MTLKQLRAFLAVAQTSNFAEASEKVFVSQPALSLAIKSLEDDLGGKLFFRTTRSVSLTPEGEVLYERGRRLMSEWERMEEEMRQHFVLERGTVSIAAMPAFAANCLPDVISRFRKNYPGINVQVDDVVAEETVAMVRNGKVELGVTFRPEGLNDADHFERLSVDNFVAILPPKHPLAEKSVVTWADLLTEDFIALQQPSMVRELVAKRLAEVGLTLDVTFDSHQFATVGKMVSAGLGVSVVPSLCAGHMTQLGAQVVEVAEPAISSELGVLTRKGAQLSVAAQALYDCLVEGYLGSQS
ncbi:MAG: LysR family transcriptional regulator [Pontibacterium sp.]